MSGGQSSQDLMAWLQIMNITFQQNSWKFTESRNYYDFTLHPVKLEKTVIYTESVFKFPKLLEVGGISQNLILISERQRDIRMYWHHYNSVAYFNDCILRIRRYSTVRAPEAEVPERNVAARYLFVIGKRLTLSRQRVGPLLSHGVLLRWHGFH